MVPHSETSDNRPYFTSNITSATIPEEQTQTSNVIPSYTTQFSMQQEATDSINPFQEQQHSPLNTLYPQLPQHSDPPQLNPSEITTVHNPSELPEDSDPTVQNTQSITVTYDSNLVQIPTHIITPNQNNNQNQDTTASTIPDNTSILSTTQTNTTQQPQTQISQRQNYDPPSIP